MISPAPDYTSADQLKSRLSTVFTPLSTLTPLSGGFANFTYRGTVSSGEPATVIIKHAEPFAVALAQNIALDTVRVLFESTALSHPPPSVTTASGFTVSTPKVHHYDAESHSLVIADAGAGSSDLKALLLSAPTAADLAAKELGEALGMWLHRLHSWGRSEGAEELRSVLARNTQAATVWTWVTYGQLVETVAMLPGAGLEGSAALFAEIAAATSAVQKTETIVHGDFWCGNVLLGDTGAMVIDWEMARVGEVWGDLAQLCAELYLPFHFSGTEAGLEVMKEFLSAYGRVSEAVARRVVVHFGVHLVVWPVRSGWKTQSDVERCAAVGKEFIERGWRSDWKWVKESVLGRLVDEGWIV